jgi:hypothetical protein
MRLRDDNLVIREIDGEMVLLDLAGSAYFVSNRAGALLLELLKSEQDRDSLIAALADGFDITTELAAADADAFVTRLEEHGLLQ